VKVATSVRVEGAGRETDRLESWIEMAKTNPMEFIEQVRRETAKVTWPSRRETGISTAMVFVFVTLAALFFFLVDQALALLVKLVLGLGG
jgi:preprotein translocase subunit SecE